MRLVTYPVSNREKFVERLFTFFTIFSPIFLFSILHSFFSLTFCSVFHSNFSFIFHLFCMWCWGVKIKFRHIFPYTTRNQRASIQWLWLLELFDCIIVYVFVANWMNIFWQTSRLVDVNRRLLLKHVDMCVWQRLLYAHTRTHKPMKREAGLIEGKNK